MELKSVFAGSKEAIKQEASELAERLGLRVGRWRTVAGRGGGGWR